MNTVLCGMVAGLVSVCRQVKYEGRTGVDPLKHLQSPAMRLDDRAADREPHPHAVRLCRHERLEQPVRRLGDYAGPGIGNGNLDLMTTFAMGLHDDQSLLAVSNRNRIYGVSQKIEQHLFDLNAIGQDGWQAGIDTRFDFDLVLRCLDASKANRGANQRPHLDERSFPCTAAHKLT